MAIADEKHGNMDGENIMKKHIVDEKNGLHYTLHEDGMYYPDLRLSNEQEEIPLGKFGLIYHAYLKEHRAGTYTHLLTSGKLPQYLAQIDREAQERCEAIMDQMAKNQGITEALKAENPLAWTGAMNNIRAAAEEIVLHELEKGP